MLLARGGVGVGAQEKGQVWEQQVGLALARGIEGSSVCGCGAQTQPGDRDSGMADKRVAML